MNTSSSMGMYPDECCSQSTFKKLLYFIPEVHEILENQTVFASQIREIIFQPIFMVDENGTLSSEILDMEQTGPKNSAFTLYSLKMRKGVFFSNGAEAAACDLKDSLERLHNNPQLLLPEASFSLKDDCVVIALKTPDPNYLKKHVNEFSVLASTKKDNVGCPLGTGPYYPTIWTNESVFLSEVQGKVVGDFRCVHFFKRDNLQNFDLSQVDSVPPHELRHKEVKENMVVNGFHRVQLPWGGIFTLLVNIEDETLRREFFDAFMAIKNEFLEILQEEEFSQFAINRTDSLIPKGFPGYIESSSDPKEKRFFTGEKREVALSISIDDDKLHPLRQFFKRYEENLPIKIALVNNSVEEFLKTTKSGEEHVNIVCTNIKRGREIATDCAKFFQVAMSGNIVFPRGIQGVREKMLGIKNEVDTGRKDEMLKNLNKDVLATCFFIPLFSYQSVAFFNSRINIDTLFDKADRIQVDKMKLNSALKEA